MPEKKRDKQSIWGNRGEAIYFHAIIFLFFGFIPVIGYIAGYLFGEAVGKEKAYKEMSKEEREKEIEENNND